MQIWKDIKDYQGLYQVSNYGRVKNIKSNKFKSIQKHKVKNNHRIYIKCGVCLFKNGKYKNYTLSRIVWETFKGEIPYNYQIDHINNQPSDNRLQNLQCITASENNKKIYVDNPTYKYTKATKIKCLNNGKIYLSQRDAARDLNIDYRFINSVLKGKHKHAKGYVFCYID